MELKTPYYVIHKEEIDYNFKMLQDSLENYWPNYIIGYSYKTNALPWIIRYFDQQGCYAEVVSEDEYSLAKRINVQKDRIIYNGPIKSKKSFLEAITNGCIVNIDSQREIEWLNELSNGNYEIGIRVNFDIEKFCPNQSQCGDEGGRFGFCYENGELEKAINRIKAIGLNISGLHFHTSSKTRSVDIYKSIAMMACEIVGKYKLDLTFIDIGGGFFGGLPSKPQFKDYFEIISEILGKCFNSTRTKLIVEPGMAVVGAAISYVTSVIDVKETTYNRFVITDGSRTNIDPLFTKKSYFYSYKRQNENLPILSKQVICGYTCMEHDRLFEADNEPELVCGDIITYDKVGAYTMCLTPLFIKYFPDVYVEKEGTMQKVRERWTCDEFIQNDNVIEEGT